MPQRPFRRLKKPGSAFNRFHQGRRFRNRLPNVKPHRPQLTLKDTFDYEDNNNADEIPFTDNNNKDYHSQEELTLNSDEPFEK